MTEPDAKRLKPEVETEGQQPKVVDANSCVLFHLTNEEGKELEEMCFGPLMSHQLYDDEEIRGYKEMPMVHLYLSPLLRPLLRIDAESQNLIQSSEDRTDLETPMREAFQQAGITTDEEEYAKGVAAECIDEVQEMGEVVLVREIGDDGLEKPRETWMVTRANLASSSDLVKTLHARMEPLLLFFVDAASDIDAHDTAWDVLFAVRKDANGKISIGGMATVYGFYVFPDRTRHRLSQMLVLPPYQGIGIGRLLMDAVFQHARNVHAVDLTLEDPTDDLRRIRDKKDLATLKETAWITSAAQDALRKVQGNDRACLAPSKETVQRMCTDFMMNKMQAKKMWEVLLFWLASEMDNNQLAVVQGFIAKTLEESFVGEKDESKNKLIVDTDTGFVMYRTKGPQVQMPGSFAPVQGVTNEKQRMMIEEHIALYMAEIAKVAGISNDGEEGDE